jgi:5-formyltetrahydrofolate cyclo-ligase
VTPAITTKQSLRAELRRVRRALDDVAERSERIWAVVTELPEVRGAGTLMAFSSIRGEPDTAPLLAWCAAHGVATVLPEDEPDPTSVDVVVVPGVAFTRDGHRLGQGGGWYDRFLARTGGGCTTVGVCFAEQVVDTLPVEAHDVPVDVVVTDQGRLR